MLREKKLGEIPAFFLLRNNGDLISNLVTLISYCCFIN